MNRYYKIDLINEYYSKNSNKGYTDLIQEPWYSGNSEVMYKNTINDLTLKGFTENKEADVTYGDHDFIIVDTKNKEWCWWENGFQPFCGLQSYPEDHDLKFHAKTRK